MNISPVSTKRDRHTNPERMPESVVFGLMAIGKIRRLGSRKSIAKNSSRSILQRTFQDLIDLGGKP